MRGSWNRKPPSGYEVVRVRFGEDGQPEGLEPFLTGFLGETPEGGHQIIGRPMGLAVTPEGALLVGDDTNGVIYRVTAADPQVAASDGLPLGKGRGDRPASPSRDRAGTTTSPATDHDASDEVGLGGREPVPPGHGPTEIAFKLPGVQAEQQLDVRSPGFDDGQPIPERFSDYGQGISPPLAWSEGPQGTRSFVILMEDPDAPSPSPYIHWVAYNIPGDVTELRESLPGRPALQAPVNLLQGRNSNGSIGYFGPRPPGGDGPHSYHFQVFALDTMLDLPPGAARAEVLEAMRGHVLAKGRVIGAFDRR